MLARDRECGKRCQLGVVALVPDRMTATRLEAAAVHGGVLWPSPSLAELPAATDVDLLLG